MLIFAKGASKWFHNHILCDILRNSIGAIKILIMNYHIPHTHGPLTRLVNLRVAHAPGMPGTFRDLGMHHDTCVTHVPWCMPGSLTCGVLWRRWRGKCSRHSRRMRNTQFGVSGKRPMFPTAIRPLIIAILPKEMDASVRSNVWPQLHWWWQGYDNACANWYTKPSKMLWRGYRQRSVPKGSPNMLYLNSRTYYSIIRPTKC